MPNYFVVVIAVTNLLFLFTDKGSHQPAGSFIQKNCRRDDRQFKYTLLFVDILRFIEY